MFYIPHEVDEVDPLVFLQAERRDVVLHDDLNIESVNLDTEQLEIEFFEFLGGKVSIRTREFCCYATHL